MTLDTINYKNLPKGFLVYRLVNLINSKCYVGLTKNLTNRIREHKKCSSGKYKIYCYIHKSIKKYGFENFQLEILELCNKENVIDREQYYITLFNSNNSIFGYNLTSGGEHPKDNDETLLKRRLSNPKMRKVASYDLEGNILKTFISIKECSRYYNISDSDIIRCCKKDWTRKNLRFKRYVDTPISNIGRYINNKSKKISEKQKGRKAINRVKCKAINKQTFEEFLADSIKELSDMIKLNSATIFKILKNKQHKKWLILREAN